MIQVDSMSGELRNSLWNNLTLFIWDKVHTLGYPYGHTFFEINREMELFCRQLWTRYWKIRLDMLEDDWPNVFSEIQQHFYGCKWFEVYDFLEFVASNYPFDTKTAFLTACNKTLQEEGTAYRLVNGLITQITDESEIAEIESALQHQPGPVQTHLRTALELMSRNLLKNVERHAD
jgi:hypothetical protein